MAVADRLHEDARDGLSRELPELPPKYLYDERGSALFDRITRLPEYYPTRCERAILNRRAPEIVAGLEEVVELGSGTASKTRALLYAMAGAGTLRRYVPFDVDASVVAACGSELSEIFPGLQVEGVVGDFERDLPDLPPAANRLLAFLGGTLGNLHPAPRASFLQALRSSMFPDDRLLLGIDLVKDLAVMEAAYNDAAGVTAEFNRNVLRVLNRRLGADFDPGLFEHVAFFDEENSWIEMRLRSRGPQQVRIAALDLDLGLAGGDEIRTEISTKFTPERVEEELRQAGFSLQEFFTDDERLFGVALAGPLYVAPLRLAGHAEANACARGESGNQTAPMRLHDGAADRETEAAAPAGPSAAVATEEELEGHARGPGRIARDGCSRSLRQTTSSRTSRAAGRGAPLRSDGGALGFEAGPAETLPSHLIGSPDAEPARASPSGRAGASPE